MDPSAGFRLRYPLHPMDAGLEFQPGIGPLAGNHTDQFLHAAQFRFVKGSDFNVPALFLGIHGIHPVEGMGKQCAFLAADSRADFQNDVFVVVGVFGQQ